MHGSLQYKPVELMTASTCLTRTKPLSYSCFNSLSRLVNGWTLPQIVIYNRRNLHQSIVRNAARKSYPLPFEANTKVKSDTLIFSLHNDRFFKLISIFGIIQFFFWANMATFTYSGFGQLQDKIKEKDVKTSSFFTSVLDMQVRHNYKMAATCVTVGKLKINVLQSNKSNSTDMF